MRYYVQPHVTQFDGAYDQGEACVPGALANGVAASTGGVRRPACVTIHRLVAKLQETDPHTPGWSLDDADKAMAKIGIPFSIVHGWDALIAAHKAGHYVVIQGDSDVFSNATCSGAFNGSHCTGAHPKTATTSGVEHWWFDDPICKTGRWEKPSVIKAYAEKFMHQIGRTSIRFGRFDQVVPQVSALGPPATTLCYGGSVLHGTKRIAVPAGRFANVRSRPTSTASFAPTRSGGSLNGGPNRVPNRTIVEFFQVTKTGQSLGGSRTWYGDRSGTRWLHSSAF